MALAEYNPPFLISEAWSAGRTRAHSLRGAPGPSAAIAGTHYSGTIDAPICWYGDEVCGG